MKRSRVSFRKSVKKFHRTAKPSHSHPLNSAMGQRGGIRL